MAVNCIDTNAKNHSGSSQVQRVLNALLPKYARVDERDEADLILFAKRYAAYLNYYDDTNTLQGDWQSFMSMDVSVTLAGIAKTDATGYQDYLKIIYKNIEASAGEADRKKYFKTVFDFIYSISLELNEYYTYIPGDFSFKEYFSSTIQARLQEPLQRLLSYYNTFKTAGYIDDTSVFKSPEAPLTITLSQNFSLSQLAGAWTSEVPVPVIELSLPNPGDASNSIYHIITHNLFNAQIDIFFKTLSNLVTQSAASLEQTLTNFPSHSPHYTLYLTFLKLFRKAQDELNLFTGRHLDFYYKDVLQLKTKEAEADSVHLILELQKGIEQHAIKQGTLFKGGKDADGIEINYAAIDETVLNRAAVKSLQSVYIEQNIAKGKAFETVYASPVANSEDGQGAKLISANSEWNPFGNIKKIKEAVLGFAVASNCLYLNEGTRTITVNCYFSNALLLTSADVSDAFDIELTGKKDWYKVPSSTIVTTVVSNIVSFKFKLDGDVSSIVGYTQKVHKEAYTTDLPVVRIFLKNVKNLSNPYKLLKGLQLNKISIDVIVSGAKDVIIQNDDGLLDPSKTFLPFGSQPKVGSSFIVGSKEIFQKKLTQLNLVIDWDDVPDALADQLEEALHEYEKTLNYLDVKRKFHTVKSSVLGKGAWIAIDDKKGMFIEDSLYDDVYNWSRPDSKYAGKLTAADLENSVISVTAGNIQPAAKTYDKNTAYSNNSINGFVKLELNYPDFGHAAYSEALRLAAQNVTVAVTGAGTANMTMSVKPASTLPPAPYTPAIKSFSINYKAYTEIIFQPAATAGNDSFFHLTPFGFANIKNNAKSNTLLPLYENEGELYAGFENVIPSSVIKVLFQVADGTSNPLKEENIVEWYYLIADNWMKFESKDVMDATKNFTQSGIVTFILPANISAGNTLFDSTLCWIKAAVKKDADAVCNLVTVQAQAIKVTLNNDKSTHVYFKKQLPANTVSKLLIADGAVKKMTQPYSSFGGRVNELIEQFYTRVSERLRHKQRAITQWDYEKIVLEEFPSLYKAKCVNHTGLVPTKISGETKYSETVPGQVTVVTIPDLRTQSSNNLLKPYTSIGLLTNIKDYLSTIISPFVKLHVLNPKFEEVQFEFNVSILAPFDTSFYVIQLSLDIEQFLCPWAYNTGRDIDFGGKISKSVVLNFIEERPYVDYVTCFKMHHYVDRGTSEAKAFKDTEEAITTSGISILVSYYNEENNIRHLITGDKSCEC